MTARPAPDSRESLSELCLSYLKPPDYSGGSWTLNPDALADAILARWLVLDPSSPELVERIARHLWHADPVEPDDPEDWTEETRFRFERKARAVLAALAAPGGERA